MCSSAGRGKGRGIEDSLSEQVRGQKAVKTSRPRMRKPSRRRPCDGQLWEHGDHLDRREVVVGSDGGVHGRSGEVFWCVGGGSSSRTSRGGRRATSSSACCQKWSDLLPDIPSVYTRTWGSARCRPLDLGVDRHHDWLQSVCGERVGELKHPASNSCIFLASRRSSSDVRSNFWN
jgi:hypothetical protein